MPAVSLARRRLSDMRPEDLDTASDLEQEAHQEKLAATPGEDEDDEPFVENEDLGEPVPTAVKRRSRRSKEQEEIGTCSL